MKKLFIILSLVFFAGNVAEAQKNKKQEIVYEKVDVLPEFVGGIKEMYGYIGKTLKYPAKAQRANIMGKVFVKMIVEKDGSIKQTSILKGIGFGCDEEVTRIVKSMPKWTAGIKDGKAVRTSYVLPVEFVLE